MPPLLCIITRTRTFGRYGNRTGYFYISVLRAATMGIFISTYIGVGNINQVLYIYCALCVIILTSVRRRRQKVLNP